MNKTLIPWVLNPDGTPGYSWNPITGCLNQVNGMCKGGNFPCYAYRLANTRLWGRYINNHNLAPSAQGVCETQKDGIVKVSGDYLNPFYPRFWKDRLAELDKLEEHEWGGSRIVKHEHTPKGIFVCDMSDLFGIGVPESWTRMVLDVIKLPRNRRDRFYLLTKQPQNLIKFSPFPDNCYVGVTATGFSMSAQALYVGLTRIDAKVKFLSYEPLLEDVNIKPEDFANTGVNWVIIGAQTKPTVYPKIGWVMEIVDACDKAGIPVFLKNNLRALLGDSEQHAWAYRPAGPYNYPKLRQEMPGGKGE